MQEGRPRWSAQMSFDELGRPLRDLTFCVVDLETTGGSAEGGSMITEIGAVKVRAGEVLGEFQTLVNPHTAIPPFIAVLTGITNSMVASAPPIESALPAFLEFAQGCVLVAHNAPFDVGFLKHFAAQQGHPWPTFEVLDTARLARRVVTRDDAPNCKLSSLAVAFGSSTTPNHRALSDARATVDVLHGLMERLGGLGVHTLEELQTFSAKVSAAQRRKRHLAESLPHAPGVYLFRDERDRVLYVGTSRDLRTRVRSYFTASETRSRMGEMVALASRVTAIECATPLEAEVRELRLIALHKPRYNRRSRFPEKVHWIKLTDEPWPRLSLVRQVLDDADDGADYLGPFPSRKAAEKCLAALHEAFPVRQCSGRLPLLPSRSPCILAEMDRCLSPCDGSVERDAYAAMVGDLRDNLVHRADEVVEALTGRMATLALGERYEEATVHRDRLAAFVRAATRTQRLSALTGCSEMVAARKEDDGALGGPRRTPRSARRGRRDPARHPRRRVRLHPARRRRDGAARSGADTRRDRGGDREDPALAGVPRHPAGPPRRRVGVPDPRGRPSRLGARRRARLAAVAGAVRRAAQPALAAPTGPMTGPTTATTDPPT